MPALYACSFTHDKADVVWKMQSWDTATNVGAHSDVDGSTFKAEWQKVERQKSGQRIAAQAMTELPITQQIKVWMIGGIHDSWCVYRGSTYFQKLEDGPQLCGGCCKVNIDICERFGLHDWHAWWDARQSEGGRGGFPSWKWAANSLGLAGGSACSTPGAAETSAVSQIHDILTQILGNLRSAGS